RDHFGPMPYKDPTTQRDYQREYARMRRSGDCRTPRQTQVPHEFRLKTAADVVAVLEEQVAAVRDDERAGTLEKARCIASVSNVALRAIEAGEIAARVDAIERALKARQT